MQSTVTAVTYNSLMLDAPRQDWTAYDERTRAADEAWLRSLTEQDRYALYCDMFDLIHNSRDPNADEAALEQFRWQQKLEIRRRFVEACQRWDAQRGRTAHENAD